MKDKRQRITAAWPYAAVYADPAFAASILQAAVNSVGIPYYGQNPMQMQMPPQLQAANHYSYNYGRYAPYPIPAQRHAAQMHPNSYAMMNGGVLPPNYQSISIPKPHTPPHDLQSPSSPQSALSLSPGSDKILTPIKMNLPSVTHSLQNGLLMTASPPSVSPSSVHNHQQTSILKTSETPKLFKPYKSEV